MTDTRPAAPSESPAPESPAIDADRLPFAAELQRKVLHLLALVVPLGMAMLGLPTVLYVLLPATTLALTGDALRAYVPDFHRFIRRFFGGMMRPREMPPPGHGIVINGATWVLVSATLLTLIIPLRVAVPILTMFMLSDAVAALVGRRWGRHPWGTTSRTVEGSAAFLGTGLGVMACFPALPFGLSALATGVACLTEAAPMPGNDNVRVPFVAALTLMLLEWAWLDIPFVLFPVLWSG